MVIAFDAIGLGAAGILSDAGSNSGWRIRSSSVSSVLHYQQLLGSSQLILVKLPTVSWGK
jgi:hypothetical protein